MTITSAEAKEKAHDLTEAELKEADSLEERIGVTIAMHCRKNRERPLMFIRQFLPTEISLMVIYEVINRYEAKGWYVNSVDGRYRPDSLKLKPNKSKNI